MRAWIRDVLPLASRPFGRFRTTAAAIRSPPNCECDNSVLGLYPTAVRQTVSCRVRGPEFAPVQHWASKDRRSSDMGRRRHTHHGEGTAVGSFRRTSEKAQSKLWRLRTVTT